MNETPRLLILGAHPDDAEFHGGGLATIYRQLYRPVKLISVTHGAAGHHLRPPDELIVLRRVEAANAGNVTGSIYETWDFPDGKLIEVPLASLSKAHADMATEFDKAKAEPVNPFQVVK